MDKSPQTDAVDRILEQWKRERPDLDCSPMGPFGRLKALEKRGFIRRLPNPDDARSMLVALTPEGRELIDRAVESHVENERELLSGLSAAQRHQLDEALTIFMRLLEKE